jgi:hypothetical protein
LGPVLASLLVGLVGLRYAILLSIVPGVLAAISITLAAREARRAIGQTPVRRTLQLQLRRLRQAGLGRVLMPIACFELGNVATTLLILRATGLLSSGGRDLGAATSVAILLYAAHNAMAAGAAPVAGHLCDRRSPWLVFVLGAVAYAVGYAVFAAALQGWPRLLAGFLLAEGQPGACNCTTSIRPVRSASRGLEMFAGEPAVLDISLERDVTEERSHHLPSRTACSSRWAPRSAARRDGKVPAGAIRALVHACE